MNYGVAYIRVEPYGEGWRWDPMDAGGQMIYVHVQRVIPFASWVMAAQDAWKTYPTCEVRVAGAAA